MSLSNNMTCITSTSGLLIDNEQQGMPLTVTLCNATKVEWKNHIFSLSMYFTWPDSTECGWSLLWSVTDTITSLKAHLSGDNWTLVVARLLWSESCFSTKTSSDFEFRNVILKLSLQGYALLQFFRGKNCSSSSMQQLTTSILQAVRKNLHSKNSYTLRINFQSYQLMKLFKSRVCIVHFLNAC